MSQRLLERVGENVRYYRLKRKLTQKGLAEKAGVHPSYISHIEHARRNVYLTVFARIAKALGVRPKDLIG